MEQDKNAGTERYELVRVDGSQYKTVGAVWDVGESAFLLQRFNQLTNRVYMLRPLKKRAI